MKTLLIFLSLTVISGGLAYGQMDTQAHTVAALSVWMHTKDGPELIGFDVLPFITRGQFRQLCMEDLGLPLLNTFKNKRGEHTSDTWAFPLASGDVWLMLSYYDSRGRTNEILIFNTELPY